MSGEEAPDLATIIPPDAEKITCPTRRDQGWGQETDNSTVVHDMADERLDTVRHFVYNDSWSVSDREFTPHDEREGKLSTAERRAREKEQRRREILDAARQEFFERGFHYPTVDDVAARAQVSKGTIYLYFESKEEILAHLLLEGLDLLLNDMSAACDPEPSSPAERSLQNLANAYLGFSKSYPHHFRLIMAFDRGRFEGAISRTLYQEVLDKSLRGLALLAQTIDMGKSSGTFHVADPWQAAGSVWAALNGVLVLMANPLRQRLVRSDLETMFQATLDLVMRGLMDSQKPMDKEVRA